jgi:glycosyltransferase involved in cell wall biosynthesis
MRVLHAISDIDMLSGGTSVTFIKLTSAQARAGLDVTAVSTYRRGADLSGAEEMSRSGVKVELIGPAYGPLRWTWAIRGRLRELVRSTDVAHVHALWEEIQHRLAREASREGVPYVVQPHGMLDPWSLSQKPLRKRVYMALRARRNLEQASAIHVTADAERDSIRPLNLRPPVILESLGVDLREFDEMPAKGWLRARFPMIGSRPIVLFLGRLHPKKGLDLLLPAFGTADTGGAVLLLAGPAESDDYLLSLRKQIEACGLNDRVFLTGMLHGRERLMAYADADLFVLPSHQENFGIAVIEAAAAGCPVLISDQVNIWRAIEEGEAGAVITLQSAELVSALERWMGDRTLRERAGRRGIELARERFDWTAIGHRWTAHYTRLAETTRRSAQGRKAR